MLKTRYKGCKIITRGTKVHVLGPKFIVLLERTPGYLERAVQAIDQRI